MVVDPFMPSFEKEAPSDCTSERALTLFELNARIRATLQHTMAASYWVRAEISEHRVASNGHCYLELVQKHEQTGSLVAKARAIIWQSTYLRLAAAFERETGQHLSSGIKVMLEVEVNYHELFGLSLTVLDIDPTYTLGDLVKRRRLIIRQLEEDGVINLNKELPMPRLVCRIAVISAETAAGYGDFRDQLESSGYGFTVRLFPAVMQGEKVEPSIIEALDTILNSPEPWDVVVIIRGGGATTDLHGFDSYLLAANIAQYPLPILTGIGHERDDTIVDLVAHTRLKTPTAVAAYLIDLRRDETVRLLMLRERLSEAVHAWISNEARRLDDLRGRLEAGMLRVAALGRERFADYTRRIEVGTLRYVNNRRALQLRTEDHLRFAVNCLISKEQIAAKQNRQRLQLALSALLGEEHRKLTNAANIVRLSSPERIFTLGYSLTLKDGRPVRSADELVTGDEIETVYLHGTSRSHITGIKKEHNE